MSAEFWMGHDDLLPTILQLYPLLLCLKAPVASRQHYYTPLLGGGSVKAWTSIRRLILILNLYILYLECIPFSNFPDIKFLDFA